MKGWETDPNCFLFTLSFDFFNPCMRTILTHPQTLEPTVHQSIQFQRTVTQIVWSSDSKYLLINLGLDVNSIGLLVPECKVYDIAVRPRSKRRKKNTFLLSFPILTYRCNATGRQHKTCACVCVLASLFFFLFFYSCVYLVLLHVFSFSSHITHKLTHLFCCYRLFLNRRARSFLPGVIRAMATIFMWMTSPGSTRQDSPRHQRLAPLPSGYVSDCWKIMTG